MALLDDIGNVITDTNISSPPVVNVLFSGQVLGEVPPDSDSLAGASSLRAWLFCFSLIFFMTNVMGHRWDTQK